MYVTIPSGQVPKIENIGAKNSSFFFTNINAKYALK